MNKTLEQLRDAMQIFANNGTVNLSVVRLREWIETLDQHIARAPLQNGGTAWDEVARDAARLLEMSYRAGFISACNWPSPVSQDVDSPAFRRELGKFVEEHTPISRNECVLVPVKPNHQQMMEGYEVATKFGVYESKAFDLAEHIYARMIDAAIAHSHPIDQAIAGKGEL